MDIPRELNGRFVLGEELLTRPNSVVYKAKDRELGEREVAIKFFFNRSEGKEEWEKEFEQEVAQLRKASHPVLVPILGGGCENEWFYIAMECIVGPSLREKLTQEKTPFSVEQSVEIAVALAEALGDLHENGVRHGHISSRSVLFKEQDVKLAGYCPKIIEKIQQGKSSDGKLLVDPAYIAPEQVSGNEVDNRADIFSLSVLLFEMLTGERPFKADNPLQMAMQRLSSRPPAPAKLNSEVGALLDAAVMKGLAADPGERFSSVGAFIEAITGGKKKDTHSPADVPGGGAVPIGTQTIGVSMSTESIREMLKQHDAVSTSSAEDSEQPGVAATMIGQKVYSESPSVTAVGGGAEGAASLVIISGEAKGKKFPLISENTIIGSGEGCEICLSGNDIPARYAIIVKRGGVYFVGALSAAGIILNGESSTTGEDVPMGRGDVLSVGGCSLRFVEPNEVFTLQDDVADRVIDRPQSKIPKFLGWAAVATAVVCLLLLFAYEQTRSGRESAGKQKAASAAAERREMIAALRTEGDALLKQGVLSGAVEPNARERFQKILALDPDDTYAKRRLAEIEERIRVIGLQQERDAEKKQKIEDLLSEGEDRFAAGRYISPPGENARESYEEVLRLEPGNEAAKIKLAEIRSILRDLVGKVNGLLAKARKYKEQGKYVRPAGKNAYDALHQALKLDPNNEDAKTMLYEMAAHMIVAGDEAKAAAKVKEMKRAYLTAQALGVDPAYVKPRLRGTDIIEKSRAEYIFVDRKSKGMDSKSAESRYLDSAILERKVAEYKLEQSISGPEDRKKFIDVRSLRE